MPVFCVVVVFHRTSRDNSCDDVKARSTTVKNLLYGEDKDESVIEADVEYLRLTRKVINDEITKFEDLKWLVGWFSNRSDLIQEHMCNTRYYTVGIPPTMFTHPEEYMKRACLFDNVYLDHIPYVVGEDGSLMAAVAPPVLHCDAATCTSVPFIDR
ncbi:hypothetical protein RR46_01118 [Papilio xuthus]|uniref:Uncharacterized protein n=1 Tax=Papilio xuthus TaxID=66420 RepID=A0A0N0P9Y5_PAPXU|nr:hypothetical protein RR46_01118 [Papilio xuthus]